LGKGDVYEILCNNGANAAIMWNNEQFDFDVIHIRATKWKTVDYKKQ
jgi:predicted PolB exonuclease-like 3'-5' exonuclease